MGTIRVIPVVNWTRHLSAAIRQSVDGDEIVVDTDAKRELAERAISRVCPDKQIKLTVRE